MHVIGVRVLYRPHLASLAVFALGPGNHDLFATQASTVAPTVTSTAEWQSIVTMIVILNFHHLRAQDLPDRQLALPAPF